MSPRVLALDLAAECSGVAYPGGTMILRAPAPAGRTRTLADNLRRLDHIDTQVAALIRLYRPQVALVEDYARRVRSGAAHTLAEIGGAVRLALWRAAVPFAVVNIDHLKKYATGDTGADKTALALAAFKRAGVEFASHDECDAWWLYCMGADVLGQPVVRVPAAQRAVLSRLTWSAPIGAPP
ncbi:crossover junction endodeoxyribonuclease RuvC [Bailinhaonella thermotolerans]|uniref:Holliday junction endonuclease n=1 Tax=Bailinhaonella thermotolerans TaxID=1070861 RepID=A0A3A4A1E4_9ACTN|nr:crossover junction endodeoxyribonuclease RuvC [Bailinhaonella thermotolerans]RJL21082.1 Holliday junction endonuclease [Bailinhaonella thermotolerans]